MEAPISSTNPVEQQSAEQKPVEQQSAEQKPAEQKPAEQQSAEQKPVEQQSAEQKQVEQQSAEQKQVEQQSAEQKPAEQKPIEQKPPTQILETPESLDKKIEGSLHLRDLINLVKKMEEKISNSDAQKVEQQPVQHPRPVQHPQPVQTTVIQTVVIQTAKVDDLNGKSADELKKLQQETGNKIYNLQQKIKGYEMETTNSLTEIANLKRQIKDKAIKMMEREEEKKETMGRLKKEEEELAKIKNCLGDKEKKAMKLLEELEQDNKKSTF